MRARIAWAVVGLVMVATAVDTVFTAAHRSLWNEATWAEHGWPLTPLASLGCALMGALIVRRHPSHPIGWLLSVASLLSVTLAADAYGIWALDVGDPGREASGHLALWAAPLLGWPAFAALVLVFLLAPDGRLPSPRWRWAVWVTGTGLVLHTLGTLTTPPGDFVYGQRDSTRGITEPLLTLGWMLVAVGLIASAVSLVVRLRRSRDDVRRQLLWVASAAVLLAVGVVVILVVPRVTGVEGTWAAALPLRVAQVAVPLCVAVAVLRHRLLAIDMIVNRAVVLALATVLVAAGYVLVVVTVGRMVDGTNGFWSSLLATAVVALAFQPLRSWVVRVADRLAFGSSAAPYEALTDFSRRLGSSADTSRLLPAVAEAAARAVNAAQVAVVLHVGAGADQAVTWPSGRQGGPEAPGLELPVMHLGERLGSIAVSMPIGHPLRRREAQLLADLADQAGLAFRNARLTVELSGQVGQLGDRTRELSDSRRRLISAGDAERSRLERAIAGQVLPHLRPLPERLRQLATVDDRGTDSPEALATSLDPMVGAVNAALESLREITRGVFPAQLARSGLPTAVQSFFTRTGGARTLVVDQHADGRRFDPGVEAAAYFCVAEATRSLGDPVRVALSAVDDELVVEITGGDRNQLPMSHIRDRVEAAGGTISVRSVEGLTSLEAWFPCPGQVVAAAHASRRRSGPKADLVM
jgi:signal transduction histidine kinase